MNFRFYDILSHLVPGFIVYVALLHYLSIDFKIEFVVPATAIAFIIGYYINALSSWAEDLYQWTWGGKPSDNLLRNNDIWKVRFYQSKKVRELLANETDKNNPSYDELFNIAMRYANNSGNNRIGEFNASYAFSRVVLTTSVIISILTLIKYYYIIWLYPIAFLIIIMSWYRSKQRGYYYAKEVLSTYLHMKRVKQ